MQSLPYLEAILKQKSLRQILNSKELAQLGDFLANFLYSTVKLAIKGSSGSRHVWDQSLKDAMEIANMRQFLGKRTKPEKVADAAEAFLGYCYFREVLSVDEMLVILSQNLNKEDFDILRIEKDACASAFSELLKVLALKAKELDYIDPSMDL